MKKLYIFVTIFTNGNSLLQESAISIECDKYFDDLLKQALGVTSVDDYDTIKIDFKPENQIDGILL
jgi:hypothetical protein